MEEKKTFPRVGARNIRLVGARSTEVEKAEGCYCPVCGGGPMNGCTGVYMEVETNQPDNSFGFDDDSAPKFHPNPGDPSICCYCGTLVAYQRAENGEMSLYAITRAEISKIKDDQPDLWRGLMELKDFVDSQIDKQRLKGDKKYAGKCTKSTFSL